MTEPIPGTQEDLRYLSHDILVTSRAAITTVSRDLSIDTKDTGEKLPTIHEVEEKIKASVQGALKTRFPRNHDIYDRYVKISRIDYPDSTQNPSFGAAEGKAYIDITGDPIGHTEEIVTITYGLVRVI